MVDLLKLNKVPVKYHLYNFSSIYPICFTVDDVQVTMRTSLSFLNSTP